MSTKPKEKNLWNHIIWGISEKKPMGKNDQDWIVESNVTWVCKCYLHNLLKLYRNICCISERRVATELITVSVFLYLVVSSSSDPGIHMKSSGVNIDLWPQPWDVSWAGISAPWCVLSSGFSSRLSPCAPALLLTEMHFKMFKWTWSRGSAEGKFTVSFTFILS